MAVGRCISRTARTRTSLIEGTADRVEDEGYREHEDDQPKGIESAVGRPRRNEQPQDADHTDYTVRNPRSDLIHHPLLVVFSAGWSFPLVCRYGQGRMTPPAKLIF
jgi:hypothetical protein